MCSQEVYCLDPLPATAYPALFDGEFVSLADYLENVFSQSQSSIYARISAEKDICRLDLEVCTEDLLLKICCTGKTAFMTLTQLRSLKSSCV